VRLTLAHPRRWLLALYLASALLVTIQQVAWHRHNNFDVFRAASANLVAGRDLYAAHPDQHCSAFWKSSEKRKPQPFLPSGPVCRQVKLTPSPESRSLKKVFPLTSIMARGITLVSATTTLVLELQQDNPQF